MIAKKSQNSFSWLQMMSIGLGVVGVGLAIALLGYFITMIGR